MSVLGVPVMSARQFIANERDICEWCDVEQLMIETGEEERNMAEESTSYHGYC